MMSIKNRGPLVYFYTNYIYTATRRKTYRKDEAQTDTTLKAINGYFYINLTLLIASGTQTLICLMKVIKIMERKCIKVFQEPNNGDIIRDNDNGGVIHLLNKMIFRQHCLDKTIFIKQSLSKLIRMTAFTADLNLTMSKIKSPTKILKHTIHNTYEVLTPQFRILFQLRPRSEIKKPFFRITI